MLVFGDAIERADPREQLEELERAAAALEEMPAGIARHTGIAALLIDGGRLHQGLADTDSDHQGMDRDSPRTSALGAWLVAVATILCRSWDSGFAEIGEVPRLPELAELPRAVELKQPEGFAFYSLYPEAYLEAARRLRLVAPARVIGIRSIGTPLGAVVAAALDAGTPVTVRPYGGPFARQVAIDAEPERRLMEGDAHYVIVDEGPGQSGSSFGAVADWLQQRGVPLDRIAFLPSHAGPLGAHASAAHRERWQAAQRETADFGHRLGDILAGWLAGLLGPLDRSPQEISGGEWRRLVFDSQAEWPAVISMFERRKFLVECGGQRFLAKFAGLGPIGEDKLRMAKALHAAGYGPEAIGLAHGFLVERWVAGAKPLTEGHPPLEVLAGYLGARARLFSSGKSDGASLAELYEMARRNIGLSLGADAVRGLEHWQPKLEPLQGQVRPMATDNRLDRHEWLRTPDGRWLKADALDHHRGHDLIGCQDLAWDVAGAIIEFDLAEQAVGQLVAATEAASGARVDAELLDFCSIAYAAFRLGLASLGLNLALENSAEAQRLTRTLQAYGTKLHDLLERSCVRLGAKA